MKRTAAIFLLLATSAMALAEGELHFSLGGKNYSTPNAQAVIETKKGKKRLLIAVKDISQRFMLVFTADLPQGDEAKVQNLNSVDSNMSVTLRTTSGTFAVLPQIQLVQADSTTYVERVDVITDELEEDPTHKPEHRHDKNFKKRKRRKMKSEYRRVKPRWHTMSKSERISQGLGIVENAAFKNTYFSLQLTPVVVGGKVVSYEGTFAGSGRYAPPSGAAEIKVMQGGNFKVKVQYAP